MQCEPSPASVRSSVGPVARRTDSITVSFHIRPPSRQPVVTKNVAGTPRRVEDGQRDLAVVRVAVVEGDADRSRGQGVAAQAVDRVAQRQDVESRRDMRHLFTE